jgi:hypothetical protein
VRGEGAGGTTIVAIVAGGLVSPTGRPLGLHEVSALAVGGTAKIRTGDTVLMLKVVGVVKASVRRDGRIQAQGSPADYARLGVVEERLDRAVEGQDVPEMFCLITDLLDCESYPARVPAAAYRWRWDGSETGLRETKSLLDGAGPSTGPMLRSRSPLLVRQELAAWALAGELVRGLVCDSAHAAAPARKGRRAGQPVHPRQLAFTAARRAAITSIRQGTAAAGLPAAAVAAGTARLLAAVGCARHVTDRNRHRPPSTKARQAFEEAHRNTPTWIAEAVLDICGQAA